MYKAFFLILSDHFIADTVDALYKKSLKNRNNTFNQERAAPYLEKG